MDTKAKEVLSWLETGISNLMRIPRNGQFFVGGMLEANVPNVPLVNSCDSACIPNPHCAVGAVAIALTMDVVEGLVFLSRAISEKTEKGVISAMRFRPEEIPGLVIVPLGRDFAETARCMLPNGGPVRVMEKKKEELFAAYKDTLLERETFLSISVSGGHIAFSCTDAYGEEIICAIDTDAFLERALNAINPPDSHIDGPAPS